MLPVVWGEIPEDKRAVPGAEEDGEEEAEGTV